MQAWAIRKKEEPASDTRSDNDAWNPDEPDHLLKWLRSNDSSMGRFRDRGKMASTGRTGSQLNGYSATPRRRPNQQAQFFSFSQSGSVMSTLRTFQTLLLMSGFGIAAFAHADPWCDEDRGDGCKQRFTVQGGSAIAGVSTPPRFRDFVAEDNDFVTLHICGLERLLPSEPELPGEVSVAQFELVNPSVADVNYQLRLTAKGFADQVFLYGEWFQSETVGTAIGKNASNAPTAPALTILVGALKTSCRLAKSMSPVVIDFSQEWRNVIGVGLEPNLDGSPLIEFVPLPGSGSHNLAIQRVGIWAGELDAAGLAEGDLDLNWEGVYSLSDMK